MPSSRHPFATNPFPCLSSHILIDFNERDTKDLLGFPTNFEQPSQQSVLLAHAKSAQENNAPSTDDILEALIPGSATFEMEVSELTLKCC